jgi:DNA-binding HxlR family transcriptional regulator
MARASRPENEWCPLDAALDVVGRTWMPVTIREFVDGPRDVVALSEAASRARPSTLSRRLRVLEEERIVSREAVSTAPLSVRYALTPKGLGLGRILGELALWAEQWLDPPAPGGGPEYTACKPSVLGNS